MSSANLVHLYPAKGFETTPLGGGGRFYKAFNVPITGIPGAGNGNKGLELVS